MSDQDNSHVHPDVRPILDQDDPTRLNFLSRDFFIAYPLVSQHLARMHMFATMPRCERMPCGLIYGPSNSGKSALINQFSRECRGRSMEGDIHTSEPFAYLLAPPQADEARLYLEILKLFAAPIGRAGSAKELQKAAEFHLGGSGIQVLFIDEFHHFVAGTQQQHRVCLHAIKNISTKFRISIVGCGVDTAFNAIQHLPELENRFFPMELTPFKLGEDFKILLSRIEARLPLKNPSKLGESVLAKLIYQRTGGLIGEIVTMCKAAARSAITATKSECIRQEELNNCGYLGPEQRRNRFLGK